MAKKLYLETVGEHFRSYECYKHLSQFPKWSADDKPKPVVEEDVAEVEDAANREERPMGRKAAKAAKASPKSKKPSADEGDDGIAALLQYLKDSEDRMRQDADRRTKMLEERIAKLEALGKRELEWNIMTTDPSTALKVKRRKWIIKQQEEILGTDDEDEDDEDVVTIN